VNTGAWDQPHLTFIIQI